MGGAEFNGCSSVALRFKRWSRGGYAAFISVVREVSIGALRVSISKSLGVKSDGLMTVVNDWLRLTDFQEEDYDLAVIKELELSECAAVSLDMVGAVALNRFIRM